MAIATKSQSMTVLLPNDGFVSSFGTLTELKQSRRANGQFGEGSGHDGPTPHGASGGGSPPVTNAAIAGELDKMFVKKLDKGKVVQTIKGPKLRGSNEFGTHHILEKHSDGVKVKIHEPLPNIGTKSRGREKKESTKRNLEAKGYRTRDMDDEGDYGVFVVLK